MPGVRLFSGFLASVLLAAAAIGEPVPVTLHLAGGGAELRRDGEPYPVKGAGGDASMAVLASAGGNSIRTWGVGPQTRAFLDAAHEQGLSVAFGIWLGAVQHGFNYNNPGAVAAQKEQVRQIVLEYKDHPAVLVWGLGNEMEGFGDGNNPALWNHIEDLAQMVKSIDPHHPTMTTIAEVYGVRIQQIHQRCPSLDIVGINTYGGASSVAQRYRAAGGTKPYMITEYGIYGHTDTGTTAWGAPWEISSTLKGPIYRDNYERFANDPLCLGSYAFVWGDKREATLTWFGMFLEDGSKLEPVDALAGAWGVAALENRCPQLPAFWVSGSGRMNPGQTLRAHLEVSDPDGDALTYEYRLFQETEQGLPGDEAPLPPEFPQFLSDAGATGVTITCPPLKGAYRLYVFVRDGRGAAATANIPIYANEDTPPPPPPAPELPVYVYGDGQATFWSPSGWMGNTGSIAMDFAHGQNPAAGATALRVQFNRAGGWGGVVWQNPAGDWGHQPGGIDLTGARSLKFWARGSRGGEALTFGYGMLDGNVPFRDSSRAEIRVALTTAWQEHRIDLAGKDLSSIKSGFYWILEGGAQPIEFFLDEIRYEDCGPADADGNGEVDVNDLLGFLGAFRAVAPEADIDGNGQVNVSDLLGFLGAFRAGCV